MRLEKISSDVSMNECSLSGPLYHDCNHHNAGPQVSDKSQLTQMYISTHPRTKTVYLKDLPTRQSSPFRRLSSTIAVIKMIATDCAIALARATCVTETIVSYSLSPLRYDDYTCTRITVGSGIRIRRIRLE